MIRALLTSLALLVAAPLTGGVEAAGPAGTPSPVERAAPAAPEGHTVVAAEHVAVAARGEATAVAVGREHAEAAAREEHAAAGQEEHPAGGQDEHAGAGGQEEHATAAGQEEHAPGEEHEEAAWWEFPARLVNFGLLLALLWWGLVRTPPALGKIFSFPGLAPLLANRAAQIEEDKAVAEERKQEAAEILTSTAARLDRIEVEVGELVEDARKDAEREKQRAEEEGRERAGKVRETARRELRAESLGARRELRAFVAALAVGMAESMLREHLGPADQERLRRDYLSRIGPQLQTPGAPGRTSSLEPDVGRGAGA